jgi:hypothetical protein
MDLLDSSDRKGLIPPSSELSELRVSFSDQRSSTHSLCVFGPETRCLRKGVEHRGSDFKQEYLNFKRIDPTPLKLSEFFQPLLFAKRACVVIPAVAYSMVFIFGSFMITVEIPQLFGEVSLQHAATWPAVSRHHHWLGPWRADR